MSKIANDLIEAYKGYYEDELERDHSREWPNGPVTLETYTFNWVDVKIRSHTSKERLEVYLHWNGIIGYTNRIWEITQGEL